MALNITTVCYLRTIQAYGTSEGAEHAWDTRGRGRKGHPVGKLPFSSNIASPKPFPFKPRKTDDENIALWVNHPVHGILYDGKEYQFTHSDWFSKLGLPSSGSKFDRITRGGVEVDHKAKTITVSSKSGFTPQQVIDDVKERIPRAKNYTIVEDSRPYKGKKGADEWRGEL